MLSIALALLLLVNNMSLALSSHRCMGEVTESQLMLGAVAVGCGMESEGDGEGAQWRGQPCCQTTVQYLSPEVEVLSAPGAVAKVSPTADVLPLPMAYTPVTLDGQAVFSTDHYLPPPRRTYHPAHLQVFRL